MVNYYFKYLELLDTVFLALKKKPLGMPSLIHSFTVPTSHSEPQLSFMYSTILLRLCCAIRNLMARPVS